MGNIFQVETKKSTDATIYWCPGTGGPDVEYDYNNVLAVYETMYENQENASKITVNAMYRK